MMNKVKTFFSSIKPSQWTILFIVILSYGITNNLGYWKKGRKVIISDVTYYYGYLPATFIYGDVTLKNPNEKFETMSPDIYLMEVDGKKFSKTTMGMAILYFPFFLLAHIYSFFSSDISSGYSVPYQLAIARSSVFYLAFGLIYARKILLEFFQEKVVSITLIVVFFATNLLFYTVIGIGMPHVYVFALVCFFLHLMSSWLKSPSYLKSFGLGLLFGLMVLIRPTSILFGLLFFIYKVNSLSDFKSRVQIFLQNYKQCLMFAISSILVWVPQMLYWKATTDSYLFFSYSGESFFWSDPKIIDFLFSFRKGWLLYSPVFVIAFFSILFKVQKELRFNYLILLFILVNVYVFSCWWVWWFGGGYGSRAMIDLYPLLLFPIAFFISKIIQLKKWVGALLTCFILVCIALNLLHTRHYHGGVLHHDAMTKEAYFQVSTKLHTQIKQEDVAPLLDHPNYEEALQGNR